MIFKEFIQARGNTKDFTKTLNYMMKASLKREYKELRIYSKWGMSFRIWKKKGLYF